MTRRRAWRVLGAVATVFPCALLSTGCDSIHEALFDPAAPSESALERLVRDRAGEDELAKLLNRRGYQPTTHRRDSPSWQTVEEYLARTPQDRHQPLRQAARVYPTIVYHASAWHITWVFLDGTGVVRGYYQVPQ